ncbi:MFS transporter [archaeon]|nr:MFS transporter [archaeon]
MEKKLFGVNKNIILLGIVSFLTDVSSEMIFAVFSVFFTIILGASTALLGLIEGLADFASSSLDYVAGYLSDKTGKRKGFTALGYGFSTLAKTILLIPSSVAAAFVFRVVERLGKSFRGPPRDAWIATLADDKTRGYSFGLHKAFDKSGAILGPVIAYFLLSAYGQTGDTFMLLFKIALIPAALAVIVLLFIKEVPSKPAEKESIFKSYKNLGKEFKRYFYTAGIFSLAYFSFGFLLLKAYSVGFEIKDVVLLYALFNIAFVVFAVSIGKLGDLIGLRKIIPLGYIIYLMMCLGFIFATTKAQVIALFVLFGIFYAIDESQSKAYITQLEQKRKGTAVGIYNFTTGIIYLPASLIAGALWKLDPNYAFGFAAAVSVAALIFFVVRKRR